MQEMMYRAFVAVGRNQRRCSTTIHEPTMFVIRWEYHNMFHQSTDWINMFQIARSLGIGRVNIVFVDGHAVSQNMDEVWHRMALNVMYFKHLEPNTCFDHAILLPLGFVSPVALTRCCSRAIHLGPVSCVDEMTAFTMCTQVPRFSRPVAVQQAEALSIGASHHGVLPGYAALVRHHTRGSYQLFLGTEMPHYWANFSTRHKCTLQWLSWLLQLSTFSSVFCLCAGGTTKDIVHSSR